ncbi:hypothetical protein [Burkholderia phage CSP3]|nr:hypothetical protein [Burkholderia phage CSP3]
MNINDRKVDHPAFEHTMTRGNGNIIACFRVGRVVRPTAEANAAAERIRAALASITPEDLALFRAWNGNVVMYPMCTQIENPETTDEMREEFRAAAAAAFPELRVRNSWDNNMHGIDGFSVELG